MSGGAGEPGNVRRGPGRVPEDVARPVRATTAPSPAEHELSRALDRVEELEALASRADPVEAALRERDAWRARAEAAEREARERGEFVAAVSHEIRTPLTAILGYVELLRDDEVGGADRSRMVENLRRSAEHLLGVVSDVLDHSRLEAGRLAVRMEEASPGRITEDAVALVREAAASKGLALEVACDPSLPARVRTDALRVRQILVNLVGNAIKFTSRGGVRVGVSPGPAPGEIRFEVRDTGVGIAWDRIRELFQPFVQVGPAGASRLAGAGLGLSISRRLARLLGGDIEVESELGKGSVFTLTIRAERAGSRVAGSGLAGRRVLLVEDGPDNRALFAELLRRAGAVVSIASEGREGIEAVRRDAGIELIVMDVDLPDVSGVEAARAIAGMGRGIPILAMTAHATPGLEGACLGAGCVELVRKPVSREAFLEACSRALEAAGRRVAG